MIDRLGEGEMSFGLREGGALDAFSVLTHIKTHAEDVAAGGGFCGI